MDLSFIEPFISIITAAKSFDDMFNYPTYTPYLQRALSTARAIPICVPCREGFLDLGTTVVLCLLHNWA